ncbi:MAG: alanine racemase [Myxococcales bacterium]|nr:alanine racemase [Myxococcales bacterium]
MSNDRDRAPHEPYFARLQAGLDRESDGVASIVLDLDRVDVNVDRVRSMWPRGKAVRLAVKSLPCIALLERLARRFETRRFMVFHPAHLAPLFAAFSDADVLFGKPLAPRAVARSLESLAPEHLGRVRWLVDSARTARELSEVARTHNQVLRAAIEIDIGLHRGGASSAEDLAAIATHFLGRDAALSFAGLMGYDGHLGRVPWPLQTISRSHARSMQRYSTLIDAADRAGLVAGDAVRNAGGSLSFMEYRDGDPSDELTIGSCLVKPAHFADKRLASLDPAMFIATPVLKRIERFVAPDGEWLGPVAGLVRGLRGPGVYVFGGRFNARPVSPTDLVANAVLGDSANQALYQLDRASALDQGDWAFFWPEESEAVMDQFDCVWAVEGDRWSRLPTLR